ncbi:hypothetical protein I7I48_06868 [Histoplasma ohiense]|nr:hypothetical protein I7I48_06868 [Histoplasma ohiense (nom. inval.)]
MHSSSFSSLLFLSLFISFLSQSSSVLSPLSSLRFVSDHITARCHREHSLFFTFLFIFLFRTFIFSFFFYLSHLFFLYC